MSAKKNKPCFIPILRWNKFYFALTILISFIVVNANEAIFSNKTNNNAFSYVSAHQTKGSIKRPEPDTDKQHKQINFSADHLSANQKAADWGPFYSKPVNTLPLTQVAVPLKQSNHSLIIDALITGNNATKKNGIFIIDTGATYTSISAELAQSLELDKNITEKITITTANGQIRVPKVQLKTLNINGIVAHNVEATIIPIDQNASFNGLLGLSFIRKFVMTIDPTQKRLIFRPRQNETKKQLSVTN
ncbi:MAG: retropepsin-like aspartic protease [Cyanobacteria bacterium P01_H01_bin.74]